MNKRSAKGKACGWRLAGLPMEWRILTGSAAIHELQNRLCEAGWKHSLMSYMVQILQHKGGPAEHSTDKVPLVFFCVTLPHHSPLQSFLPTLSALFLVAEHKIYKPSETCCFQMQAPSASPIASCPALRAEGRTCVSRRSPPSIPH